MVLRITYTPSLELNIVYIKNLCFSDEIRQKPRLMARHIKCSVLETVILQLRICTIVVLFCAQKDFIPNWRWPVSVIAAKIGEI